MPQNKDSLANTFIVATVLCLVCAALVSTAAVALKPYKLANILLDKRTNILKVCEFTEEDIDAAGGVNDLFLERFETVIIDLETGELAMDEAKEACEEIGKQFVDFTNDFDQIWCSKSKEDPVADKLEKKADIVGIKYREKYSHVFILRSKDKTKIEKYVFPVRSYGLWSMMKGYLAVEPDLQTVAGLTFYEHAETPGLGGEITNPVWKAKWPGKKIYDDGEVELAVKKAADEESPYEIDALSGATITSNGVTSLVEFWMGDRGFGAYIEKQKSDGGSTAQTETNDIINRESASKKPAKSGVHHG
ncbi:MAG: Na(+)-translocating NADH-quinone reductase subunit C [Planctomycetota bacterium]